MSDIASAPEQESTPFFSRPPFLIVVGVLLLAAIVAFAFALMNQREISSQGIVYPINGQAFSGPSLELYSTAPLNQLALAEALTKNGEPLVISSIDQSGLDGTAYRYILGVSLGNEEQIDFSAAVYNEQKDQLEEEFGHEDYPTMPADLSWTYAEQEVFIDRIVETKDSELTKPQFEAQISGSDDLADEELVVFSLNMADLFRDAEERPMINRWENECRYAGLDRYGFDWSQFTARSISIQETTNDSIVFEPGDDWGRDDSCFFVTLMSDASSVDSFYANPIMEPGAAVYLHELYNPDLDFKSTIAIDFKTPYFDTKKKRDAEEEIAYRHGFKKQLAALISAKPSASIDPEEITLYSNRALVPMMLEENTRYTITLAEGQDIFGGTFESKNLEVETGELKYLGLRQQESQAVFMDTAPPSVDILHYDVDNPTLKLCRIDLESYAKIEHVVSRRGEIDGAEDFLLSGIDDLPVRECDDQLIELDADKTRSSVDMSELLGSPARSGLYYLTFAFQSERKVSEQSPAAPPLFFSVVDSHITMKISRNGKALFWVNDLHTGEGVSGLTLRGYQNVFKSSESSYNYDNNEYDYTYFDPVTSRIFEDAVVLGTTDNSGFLEVDLNRDDYLNAFQTWWDNGEHRSLAVTASSDDHLTYVVSKWNSGIADWNFGFSPSEWGEDRTFSAHMFTDRKLYKPGETVHFKAIVREQMEQLSIPSNSRTFTLKLVNPNWETVWEESISLNEWGTHMRDIQVGDDWPLGIYRLDLQGDNGEYNEYIRQTEFSVEEFEKPTFKIDVSVSSPDLQDESFTNPEVDEERTPWGYRYKIYKKDLSLQAKVMASYYSGGNVPNASYTYTVYKQYYYDNSWWDDCYYGCYWEPYKDYYTEGSGTLDGDGTATIDVDISHETSWDDYRYIVEVAVTDETSARVAGSGSVIVKVPSSLRQSSPYNAVDIQLDPQFVTAGEDVTVTLKPERKWDEANDDRYQFVLERRKYTVKNSKQVGGDIVPQVDYEDFEIETVDVSTKSFTVNEDGSLSRKFRLKEDGEYFLTFQEASEGDHYAIKVMKLYAYNPNGVTNTPVVADNKVAVVAEKTSYHLGETARLLIRLPFSGGKALITTEKQSVVDRELIDIEGNTLVKEIEVDDTFVPNAYISVIAFKPAGDSDIQPEYKVGYAEIVVDKTDKKLFIEAETDAQTYSPRDEVNLELSAEDRTGSPVRSDLTVAVVDEALIAMLGNIDLDILPKFFQKISFQTHTALTNVAMMKHLYFARKGIIGGSGGKEGGDSIFTRTDFKNTAFYAGSVITNASGNASLSFDLPDNIGDFRVIVIGHSKNNFFGATEQTIQVRQEVIVEEAFPLIVRKGDDMRVGANVFNNSSEDKTLTVSLDADGLSTPDNNRQDVTIKAGEREFVTWRVRVQDDVRDEVSYTLTALDQSTGKGDRIQKTSPLAITPLLADRIHFQDDFETNSSTAFDLIADVDAAQTRIELSFSTTILAGVEKILTSLVKYPYGCIEQTISSTMPNAIVSKFRDLLDVDVDQATLDTNIAAGVKRFASMQVADGGFAYWEGSRESEPHITPYALLSLVQMRDLGVNIPADMISKAQGYIENQISSLSGSISEDRLSQLVHELHALSRLDSNQFANARTLIQNRLGDLTVHEKIVYSLALAKKDVANYRTELSGIIKTIDLNQGGNSRNWYWDKTADKALFTQLLILVNPQDEKIPELIRELYQIDWSSYYYSTQAKIQAFIAFTQFIEKVDSGKGSASIDFQLGSETSRVRLSDRNIFTKLDFRLDELWSDGELTFNANILGDGSRRVYTDLVIYQIPEDPTSISAQQDKGVTVKRQYFKLGKVVEGENYWSRPERDLAPLSGNTFTLGETYLVKITVDFDQEHREVALESYLPAGLRVLNTRFLTEADQVGEDQWNWPFSYQEFRPDRFFASARYYSEYNGAQEVTYYVRATTPGTFLEPPVSVYPMYRPEVEAHTAFREIVVQE